MPSQLSQPKFNPWFASIFWLFNISLLLILLVGFVPFIALAILNDAVRGDVPLSILIPTVGLIGVPATSSIMGRQRNRSAKTTTPVPPKKTAQSVPTSMPPPMPMHQPLSLFQIFFGIEAPLLMACTIRLFFLRNLTPASGFLFISMILGSIALVHGLLHRHQQPSRASWAHLAGLTIMLVLSLYLSAIALFYLWPVLHIVSVGLVYLIFLLPIFFPLLVMFSGWMIMPGGMVILSLKSWRQILEQLSKRHGKTLPRAIVAAVLAGWLGILLLIQQQPQTQAFQLLEHEPQSVGDRQALLQQSDTIRKGLLNAYLSAYRYPLLENRTMVSLYQHYLGWPEAVADAIQNAYNTVLSPFAYQGSSADKDKAAQLYAKFFDTPILRGEHKAIQTAVQSNFNRAEAKAGLLDINAERVALQQQDINITPHGDWAEIELHEVYANTTWDETEILYYFSLPESATVTGLWLGETGDRTQRYEHTVSPRGAAQQVYNDQVRRRVDPALLEQVGPRNYRLRAFPIPPVGRDSLPADGQPDKMHLWLTYTVMKQNNQWPLPILSERRNIFWTGSTKRTLNGQAQPRHNKGSNTGNPENNYNWLPLSIPADDTLGKSQTTPPSPSGHQVPLSGGYIVAKPMDANAYQYPEGQHFAIVLDGSYSMNAHKQEVVDSIQWLKDNLLNANTADLYLTQAEATQAKKVNDLATFDPEDVLFYGSLQTRQLLSQYQQAITSIPNLRSAEPTSKSTLQHPNAPTPQLSDSPYDAIILITDSGSYELTEDSSPLSLSVPLWLVHLGGLPSAYDDATLETIQRTGGNTATQIETAITRIATQPSLGEKTSLLNVVDGYAWFLRQTPDPTVSLADTDTATKTTATIAPMAARQWITQVSQAVKPDELNQLDAIHHVAKENSIVTPYSSMLVLVNAQQEQQLKDAESKSDRFSREIEDQQLPDPESSMSPVSAVPEPAEWLLLITGVAILGIWYRHRQTLTPSPTATDRLALKQ